MFPLPRRPMRVLAPVIEIPTLAMLDPWEHLPLRRTVALQLVRNNDPRHILQALQQLAEKLLRRLFVAAALHQNIQDIIVLIHRPPQIMAFAMDRKKNLIQMPLVSRPRATASQPIGVVLSKLPTPLTDGFVGHGDAALE